MASQAIVSRRTPCVAPYSYRLYFEPHVFGHAMSADEYLQRADFAEEPQLVTGEDANSVDDLILERSEEYRIVPDAAPG